MKILIVDDRGELRKLVAMTLAHGDFEFAEAENGRDAVSIADLFRPDLVILDVMMPGDMDGFKVCRALRANANLGKIRIVMLTAKGQEQDRKAGQAAGADAFIVKPFSPLTLIEVVGKLLNNNSDHAGERSRA